MDLYTKSVFLIPYFKKCVKNVGNYEIDIVHHLNLALLIPIPLLPFSRNMGYPSVI